MTTPPNLFVGQPSYGQMYELFILLTDTSDSNRAATVEALWNCPSLEGCYLDGKVEPWQQPRVRAADHPGRSLIGVATLPSQNR